MSRLDTLGRHRPGQAAAGWQPVEEFRTASDRTSAILRRPGKALLSGQEGRLGAACRRAPRLAYVRSDPLRDFFNALPGRTAFAPTN